ncbi:MAG: hypothetical protein AAGA68_23145 [Pseudomonadota bacterium]
MQRIALGGVLAPGLALLARLAGMFVAGHCCVPEGSGLAGPGIVVGYGFLAALGGLADGIVLACLLPWRTLLPASVLAGLGGTVVAVALVLSIINGANQSSEALAQAYERLPVFELDLTLSDGKPFDRFTASWATRETAQIRDGAPPCRRELPGQQAVQLLESLRSVEGVTLRSPQPCAAHPGSPVQTLSFRIEEGRPPNTSAAFAISAACLAATPALGAPLEAARQALRRGGKCLP